MQTPNPRGLAVINTWNRRKFVLIVGVLGWGVPTAVLYSLLQAWSNPLELLIMLPISLIIFPLAGILFGLAMWWVKERLGQRN